MRTHSESGSACQLNTPRSSAYPSIKTFSDKELNTSLKIIGLNTEPRGIYVKYFLYIIYKIVCVVKKLVYRVT